MSNTNANPSDDQNFFNLGEEAEGENKKEQPTLDLPAGNMTETENAEAVSEETEEESQEESDSSKAGEEVKELSEAEVEDAEKKSVAKAEEVKEEEEKVFPVIDDPYDSLDHCQVTITYSLLPIEGIQSNWAERDVIVAAFDHDDEPLIRTCKARDLGTLPNLVTEMLEELQKTLPERAAAYTEDKHKEKEEAEKRKARFNKSKTSSKTAPKSNASSKPNASSSKKSPSSAGEQVNLFDDLMSANK